MKAEWEDGGDFVYRLVCTSIYIDTQLKATSCLHDVILSMIDSFDSNAIKVVLQSWNESAPKAENQYILVRLEASSEWGISMVHE